MRLLVMGVSGVNGFVSERTALGVGLDRGILLLLDLARTLGSNHSGPGACSRPIKTSQLEIM